jgi:ribosomal protein S18 acetylase RimI-like enzyme
MDQEGRLFANQQKGMDSATGVALVPMTTEMVPAVAKVHLEAFTGYMNTGIGTAYVRAFMNWFLQAERAIALVATNSEGQVIGYVVGAPLGYESSMSCDLFWVAAAGMIVRPWLFFNKQFRNTLMKRLKLILGRSLARQTELELPEPIMSLVGIGVSPSAQGKKVGLCLMQAFEAKVRRLQMQSIELSVYPDNVVARRLYERCGWQALSGSLGKNEVMHYFRVLTEKPDQSEAES